MQSMVVICAFAGLCWVALRAAAEGGVRFAMAVFIGAIAGVALYHAAFGFTGAWRRFVRERRGAGLRAQMLLIALCVMVTFPLITHGEVIGIKANGWVNVVGVVSALGALVFGIGMQLGGGCGSGTLFTAGGGSVRMVLTLMAFVGGSVLWTGTHQAWQGLPSIGRHSAIDAFGMPVALIGTLMLLGGIAWASLRIERAAHGAIEETRETMGLLRGPWSLWLGAIMLALVVVATFVTLGRPWGITAAFASWGVKSLDAVGVPIQQFNGWSDARVARSVFANSTSVMNFGVMLGALAAAGLAQRFAPSVRLTLRDVLTALIGGVLMGYGARMATGCNIGGFLGGVVSGSLHGWSWLVFGYIGSCGGIWLRRRIGMDPPILR